MTGHSKSPWTHTPGGLLKDADGKFLGTAWQAFAPDAEPAYPTEAQFRANARLMAAAPELYEALLLLAEAARCGDEACHGCQEAAAKTRAVIARVSAS